MKKLKVALIVAAVWCLSVVSAVAQTTVVIVLPSSSIQFTASPDHAALGIDGNPLLTSYQVTYCTTATPSTCLPPITLGKPTPDTTNTITVSQGLFGALVANTIYTATAVAIGPGGTSVPTAVSNPFGAEGAPRPGGVLIIKR